jgi:uncharacterized membrane protein (UPF0127 family)
MSRQTYRLRNATRGGVIAERIVRAGSAWARMAGLIGRRAPVPGEGLWLIPCNGIHTFGMRFPLDVLILDRDRRILRVVLALRPCRVRLPVRGGHSVVELPAGILDPAGVRPGDIMEFEE